jgi:hypothetical protein
MACGSHAAKQRHHAGLGLPKLKLRLENSVAPFGGQGPPGRDGTDATYGMTAIFLKDLGKTSFVAGEARVGLPASAGPFRSGIR